MKTLLRRSTAFLAAVAVCFLALCAPAATDLTSILAESDEEVQQSMFVSFVRSKLSYATAASFCGKSDKWMAFVDFYENYEAGKVVGYSLQKAMVQYGFHTLPYGTESCALTVDGEEETVEYDKQAVFLFPGREFTAEADISVPSVSVCVRGESIDIPLTAEELPGIDEVLTAMAPVYLAFAAERPAGELDLDHAFLTLKSYVKSASTADQLQRSFTWELSLVHSADTPSKATIIRYDCEAERFSVTQRTLRS